MKTCGFLQFRQTVTILDAAVRRTTAELEDRFCKKAFRRPWNKEQSISSVTFTRGKNL